MSSEGAPHILPFKDSRAVWFSVLVAALLLGCGQSKDQALEELAKLNVKFTSDDFVQAADRGDLKALQLFLDGGMDCNAQNTSGSTALMAGAKIQGSSSGPSPRR
jgi:predicted component of type VI protein secretion system